MTEFDKRPRDGGKVQQRFTRVRPVEFEGSDRLEHREGGAYPLFVKETSPGMFLSSWMIDADHCRKFIREIRNHSGGKRQVVLSLVIDTNVPGHPTVSMQLQEIFITPD
jgi:hypothetical protein